MPLLTEQPLSHHGDIMIVDDNSANLRLFGRHATCGAMTNMTSDGVADKP